jgi:hypothetical protein
MNEEELMLRALDEWGFVAQYLMYVEENAELQKEICHYLRTHKTAEIDDIIGELVDMEVMLKQMKLFFKLKHDADLTVDDMTFDSKYEITKTGKLHRLEMILNDA